MTTNVNNQVLNAITRTSMFFGEYFDNTCKQRLEDGLGSYYEGIRSIDDMIKALKAAKWVEATHPDVAPGCKAFKTTDIKGGHYGMVQICELGDDAVLTAVDPKNTGFAELEVQGRDGEPVKETWLITGIEDGHEIVYTFHPGEPVRPSVIEVTKCPVGKKLSRDEALKLGFTNAKIVRSR